MNSKMQLLTLFMCEKSNSLYIYVKKLGEHLWVVYQHLHFNEKKADYIATSFPLLFLLYQLIDVITSSFQKSFFPLSSKARLVK